MYVMRARKQHEDFLTFKDISELRSSVYVGMKAIKSAREDWFEAMNKKQQVTVCDKSRHTFTVEWIGAMGDKLRESYKYVDVLIGDKDIILEW